MNALVNPKVFQKVPPHSIEAEQSVLGSVLISNGGQLSRELFDLLTIDAFYSHAHQEIFKAMLRMRGKAIDLITLEEALNNAGKLEEAGGFAYLAEIAHKTPSAANALQYADIINRKYRLRQLIGIAHGVTDGAYSGAEFDDLMQGLATNLANIEQTTQFEPEWLEDGIAGWLDRMEARAKQDVDEVGVKTKILGIDQAIGGIKSDWLVVLAGRPSMGKTLISQIISSGVSQQFPVLFFSMEMSKKEIVDRYMAVLAGISPKAMTSGLMDKFEQSRAAQTIEALQAKRYRIAYDDTPGLALQQISARAKAFIKRVGKTGLIVVDYLGLMQTPKAERNDIAIGMLTKGLKQLAKETHTPVLLLAQANRGTDHQVTPTMANLKDSSAIEADADLIMFVHRKEVTDPHTAFKGVTEIIPAKFRHGNWNRSVFIRRSNEMGKYETLSAAECGDLANQDEKRLSGNSGNGKRRKPEAFNG